MNTKPFPTLAILSVTTGRLLTKPTNGGNGIEQIYELLGWMTGDSPFTHQLPRFGEECKPWLLRWHPQLADVASYIVSECEAGRVLPLRDELESQLGKTLEVAKIPQDDHERKNAYHELVEMRGTDEGIITIQAPTP